MLTKAIVIDDPIKILSVLLMQIQMQKVIEMDTVKGSRDGGKVFLTMLFRNSSFTLILLFPQGKQKYIQDIFDLLTEKLGIRLFQKTFPVILTDNRSEFKDPSTLENTSSGRCRTYIFYCDPYISNQKGKIERNHEFIRYDLKVKVSHTLLMIMSNCLPYLAYLSLNC